MSNELQTTLDEIKLDKDTNLLPENLKAGVTCMGVTGTYEGGSTEVPVKLFVTVDEMNQSEGNKEGDLALVYSSTIPNWQEDTESDIMIFPETIVLQEPVSEYISMNFEVVNEAEGYLQFNGIIEQNFADINIQNMEPEVNIRYTSEDGMTYTKETEGDERIELPAVVKYSNMYDEQKWNDVIGQFIKTEGNNFDGLYKYSSVDYSIDYICKAKKTSTGEEVNILVPNVQFPSALKDVNQTEMYLYFAIDKIEKVKDLKTGELLYKAIDYYIFYDGNGIYAYYIYFCLDENDKLYPYYTAYPKGSHSNKKIYYQHYINQELDIDESFSIDNDTEPKTLIITEDTERSGIGKYKIDKWPTLENFYMLGLSYSYIKKTFTRPNGFSASKYNASIPIDKNTLHTGVLLTSEKPIVCDLEYIPAPVQFNATDEYVYSKRYYGKNAASEGTIATNPSLDFSDIDAEIYDKLQKLYNTMEPKVVEDGWKADKNIKFIFVKSDGIPLLDTSNVINMNSMFVNCKDLVTIPLLNTSSVTKMTTTFIRCTNLKTIALLDTSNVEMMDGTFEYCSNLTTIPLFNTKSVINMNRIFSGCTNLQEIPLLNTSNVKDMGYMFENCENLKNIPLLDTSSATTMQNMFRYCTNLQEIPLLNTSNVEDMQYMFSHCSNLITIPKLDTFNVTNMNETFNSCTNLQEIPLLNTSNVTIMQDICYKCTNLTTIPVLDTSSVTTMYNAFAYCDNLSNDSLNNILKMCINAKKYPSYQTKTLKAIGLTQEQVNVCKTLSNWSDFEAAGWSSGY